MFTNPYGALRLGAVKAGARKHGRACGGPGGGRPEHCRLALGRQIVELNSGRPTLVLNGAAALETPWGRQAKLEQAALRLGLAEAATGATQLKRVCLSSAILVPGARIWLSGLGRLLQGHRPPASRWSGGPRSPLCIAFRCALSSIAWGGRLRAPMHRRPLRAPQVEIPRNLWKADPERQLKWCAHRCVLRVRVQGAACGVKADMETVRGVAGGDQGIRTGGRQTGI